MMLIIFAGHFAVMREKVGPLTKSDHAFIAKYYQLVMEESL